MRPPRWTVLFLRCVVPCETVRDAIFGDLHEEFVRDVEEVGADRARDRYRDRAVGIAAHAFWDSFRWRTWASTSPERERHPGEAPRAPTGSRSGPEARSDRETPGGAVGRRAGQITRRLGASAAAFALIGAGIVVNTSAFAAVEGASAAIRTPLLLVVIGAGGLAFMLACATVAAIVFCRDARGRRLNRPSRSYPVSPTP